MGEMVRGKAIAASLIVVLVAAVAIAVAAIRISASPQKTRSSED